MISKYRLWIVLTVFLIAFAAIFSLRIPTQPDSAAQVMQRDIRASRTSREAVKEPDRADTTKPQYFGDLTSVNNDFFYKSLLSIYKELYIPPAEGRTSHLTAARAQNDNAKANRTKSGENSNAPAAETGTATVFNLLKNGPVDTKVDDALVQRQIKPDVVTMIPVSQDANLNDLPYIPPTPQEEEEKPLRRYPLDPNAKKGKQDRFQTVNEFLMPASMPVTLFTFDGVDSNLSGCGCLPPDSHGDVGPNHYIHSANSSIRLYDKTGSALTGPVTYNSFFAAIGPSNPCGNNNNGGDGIVFYDHLADRWVVSDFAQPSFPGTSFWQCVGVSKTSDPVAGGWWLYSVQVDPANPTFLGDYPKFGLWPDAYYLSMNEFSNNTTFTGVRQYALDRNSMINGGPANAVGFSILPADIGAEYSLLPATFRTGDPPPAGQPEWFMSINSSAVAGTVETQVFVRRFHVDFVTPANSFFGVGATHAPDGIITVNGFVDAFQGAGGNIVPNGTATATQFLDTLGDKLMTPLVYQSLGGVESIYSAHSVNNNQGGTGPVSVRWYQFNMTANTIPANPAQQQTFNNGGDGLWRWMPSINVDRQGNMAIGYSASSDTINPGIRYAGRLAGDPVNSLSQGEGVMYAATGHQTSASGRWGDYSSMFVDPSDSCTFWHVNEYYSVTGGANWRQRIGTFKFPGCPATPLPTPTPAITPTPLPSPTPVISAGPVTVTATLGTPGPTDYATLQAAFLAINTGTHKGDVNVFILGDTTETVPAILTASGVTGASYTSIRIQPSGGAPRTVSGNLALPLVDLVGANNVTIDGMNTGGNSLTISNTNTGAVANTSTIRFLNGASNNIVKNSSILGSSTVAVTTAGGNILFGTTTGTGNNNNIISGNNIGPAGANLPVKCISAVGTTTNAATINTGDIIDNNNIFDFFIATAATTGIDIRTGNTAWTISNNRIYQTAPRTFTTSVGLRYSGITFSGSTGTGATGNFMNIVGNTIGFGAANGTGTTTITGTGNGLQNEVRGIDMQAANAGTATSVQGNIISGFNQTSARLTTTTGLSAFAGIQISSAAGASATGVFDIGTITGNTIGSLDGSSTIVITASSVTANTTPIFGILDFSSSSNNVSNNKIGAITIQGTGTVTGFRGIFAGATAASTHTVNNNIIGGAVAAGAVNDTQAGSYALYGIQTSAAAFSINGNTIRNLNGNANAAALVVGGGIAMSTTSTTGVTNVSRNTISNLTNNSGTASNSIYAIDLTFTANAAVTGNLVERNFIHSNSITSTDNTCQIWGIVNRGAASATATATVQNNMIRLGIDGAGNPITSGFSIIGIRDIQAAGASVMSYYFNSVYIGGNGVVASSNTFALNSGVTTTAHNFKDNIFWNARSNASGAGKNYAIAVGGTTPNPAGLTSNYNDLFANGTGGFTGLFNAADQLTLANWQTATGQDANSISADALFFNSTGAAATVNLHIQPGSPSIGAATAVAVTTAAPLTGIGNDFDGETRKPTPDIGADETAPVVAADLGITKTDGVTTAVPGGSVTYTITVSNGSVTPATGATVADTFPAILTGNWTCVGAGGGTCTAGPVAGNINDTVNLPAGASVTYTATKSINAGATGSLSNTATVTLAGDPNAANNSATDIDTLTPQADLAITKTDGVTTATPGGSLTYTITASNAGPSNTTATVADTFPASLTVTWTCVGAGGGTCTAGPVAGNINDAVTLPVGGSVTYTASASISAAATGTLSNTATVTGAATDPVPGNNSATDTDTLTAQANLGITKTDGVTTAVPGGSVTYTIVASNAGPSNTTATVADTFPASLTVTWTCAGAGGGTCTAAGAGNINDPVNLPVGGSVTYTASASISVNAAGSLSNTATVTGAATDPVPGNNSATDTDTLTPQANLAITKTDGVATAVPGGSVTYTITASNAGPSNAPGSNVTDNFPAAITGVNWTCVGAGGGTCTASGSGNINQTVNLPVGGSVTFTAVAAISAAATGTLANTATTATGVGVNDPTPGNNSATDTDTLTPQANLGITKTDGVTTVNPGGSTTYTITASNAGPSNAPGTTVADIFPAILTCTTTSVAAGGATGNAAGPFGGNINNTLNMPVGSSVTYTSVCNISGAASGTLTNTATVTAAIGVTDPTPGNNTATDADIIVVPPTISKNFTSPTIVFGEVTSLNIIVGNPATNVVNLTGVSFTDTLPAGITVPNLGPIALCGGSYSATAPNTVALTGATITPGTTCTATVAVTGVQIGPWTNTINSVSSTNGGTNNTPASAIITVNKASTTASVISDTPDPSVFGQNYTVGAQVIVTAPGSPTPTAPTGTITVTDGTNNCTITLSAASCLLPSTSVGAKTLTATYNGDGNFNASLASPGVPHTVNKANTATVVTSSANPSAFGQNVGFTATVSAAAPGAGTPTGTVTFAIDGVNQPPATLSGGSVTMNTSTLSVGTHTITAQYNGDANFNTSNGALAGGQVVGKANTTTVITNAAALASTASNSGQPYAVNFTVTPAVPGAGTPTGFVSVTDGTDICLGTVASGTCNLTSTTAGVKTITATYLGDPNFNSSSGTATHTVLASISGNIQQFVPPVANLAPEATTPLAGVTVSITGTAPLPASTTTDANGNYSFGGLTLGGNYTVTPTMAGKSFEPLSRSYTNVTANVTGADFVAYAPAVPREIKALNAYALQGQPAVMQLVLTGLGNEKTESFSLNFNINELSAPTVACGTSDAGCTIATDTSQPGKIGITVTPATQLAAGPRNIANVTFQTFASEPPNSPVTFGGAPTPQSITDAVGNPLQTAYTGAFAVFAKGFEGDVAPRPNGSGETDSSDIVGVSRFVAGLDNPVLLNTNEFQRADASPNGLKGDGKIDSTDIVQTTRYGAGLDGGTHVIVAGPMQALPLPPALTRAERSDEDREIARAKRTMRVGSVKAAPGSDVEISVELDSRGDEVASSFTLNFDPARLRISGLSSPEANPDVAVGRDAPAGTGLAVNATNAARGQIGIVVFNANLIPFSNATGRKVVTLHFRIAEDAPTGPSPITFGDTDDSPTQRSLSDGNANPLKSTYTDGKVNIIGRNPAGSEISGRVVTTDGTGVMKAVVEITDSLGKSRQIVTGSFGVFHFGDVSAGETYSIRVSSKRYRFAPKTLAAGTDLADLTISADPGP